MGPDTAERLANGKLPLPDAEPRFCWLLSEGRIGDAVNELYSYADEEWARYDIAILTGTEIIDDASASDLFRALGVLAGFIGGRSDGDLEVLSQIQSDRSIPASVRVLAANVMVANAIEHRDDQSLSNWLRRLEELDREAGSAVLRTVIRRTLLSHRESAGIGTDQAIKMYREIISTLDSTDLADDRAACLVELGTLLQGKGESNPGYFKEAVKCYQEATKVYNRSRYPEIFASLQLDIAVCYLAMPMADSSNAIRYAVAISALREAGRVFTQESDLRRWASVQLNLANALVYADSSHLADNQLEACKIYADVVASNVFADEPLGYARVVFNWGNVLAHIGDFEQAKARLHEARRIFEEFQCFEEVRTVRDILDEMERVYQRGRADEECDTHPAR
jgi:tetratricopeptide (TPR) repeat protein